MEYLKKEHIDNESSRQHAEREHAWLELLEADCMKAIHTDNLLNYAYKAKCYRVAQEFLEKRGSFESILNCYLLDAQRHCEMWDYIRENADKPERKIFEACKSNIIQLLAIDSNEISKIIVDKFGDHIEQLIRLLEHDEEKLYSLMQNLVKHHVKLNANDCEHYLDLLCKNNPENVEEFLRKNSNYRLENALEIVKKYELLHCLIYLFEKRGDFESAFNMSLELLKEAPESTAEMKAIELCGLCTRASKVLSDAECETLWFTFIESVLARTDLSMISKSILHSSKKYVNLSNLVQLVLNSGAKTRNFGDIKDLLLGMLDNSKFETILLQTTARVHGLDLHHLLQKQRMMVSRGIHLKSVNCIVCRMGLYNQQDILLFGSCGHASHKSCVPETNDNDVGMQKCSFCGTGVQQREPIRISTPTNKLFPDCEYNVLDETLHLEAPPRFRGYGGLRGKLDSFV